MSSSVHQVTHHPGRRLTLEQLEPLIHGRLASIKSALVAGDPDGTGLVSKEEFRRVLESLLSVSQNRLDAVLSEVRGTFSFSTWRSDLMCRPS